MTRYVVALEIAGTARLAVAAPDADRAVEAAYRDVRRSDIRDWWPRRHHGDFVPPSAGPLRAERPAFDVGLPIVGTAYVAVEAEDGARAAVAAYAHVTEDDIDDWRPIRAPVDAHPPSVALEADTVE